MFAWRPGIPATHVAVTTNEDVVLPWGSGHHGHEPKGSWCVCVCVWLLIWIQRPESVKEPYALWKTKKKQEKKKKKTVAARKHKTIGAFVLTLLSCCHLFISLPPPPSPTTCKPLYFKHAYTLALPLKVAILSKSYFLNFFPACWLFDLIIFSSYLLCKLK